MSAIHIEILVGPTAGLTGSFIDPPVTFGRNADNAVVLDTPLASRRHGELVQADDAWYVTNQSANGTTVNGKKVGDKPHPLRHGDTVGVGKQKLFRVTFEQTTYENAAGETTEAEPVDPLVADERAAAAKKMKLWIGIGVYLFVMLIGFVVLSQVIGKGGGDGDGGPTVAQLTDEQIADEIRRPLRLRIDEREADKALEQAKRSYELRDIHRGALYEAHDAFKRALAHSGQTSFTDGMVIREFRACEDELVARVNEQYDKALHLRRSQQWAKADQALRELLEMYPDNHSRLYRNVIAQLRLVKEHRPR